MLQQLRSWHAKSRIHLILSIAHQADRSSPLKAIGETCITFTRDETEFEFEGLVVENLVVEILGGTPFMEKNDLTLRPVRRQLIMGDGTVYFYGSSGNVSSHSTVRRACVLRERRYGLANVPKNLLYGMTCHLSMGHSL